MNFCISYQVGYRSIIFIIAAAVLSKSYPILHMPTFQEIPRVDWNSHAVDHIPQSDLGLPQLTMLSKT